jgi:hypothetical protein
MLKGSTGLASAREKGPVRRQVATTYIVADVSRTPPNEQLQYFHAVHGISTVENSQALEECLSYPSFPMFSSTSLVCQSRYRYIFVSTTPSTSLERTLAVGL